MLNMKLVHYTRILLLASAATEAPRGPRLAGPWSATGLAVTPGPEPRLARRVGFPSLQQGQAPRQPASPPGPSPSDTTSHRALAQASR